MSPNIADGRFGKGKTVAVIGGGISGVCAASHLLKRGLSVTLFERSTVQGGVWNYDERVSVDPLYPNSNPSLGDYKVSTPGEYSNQTTGTRVNGHERPSISTNGMAVSSDLEVEFSPPGPCYVGLKTNVPTPLMASSLGPWPEGTEPSVAHSQVRQYIDRLARDHGVNDITHFQTRVDQIRKLSNDDANPKKNKWEVRTVSLESASGRLVEKIWYFDLVTVATGHYSMPRIPDITGLEQLKAAFPRRVIHSKQYRKPDGYKGQNILVIGGGVSSLDICRETGLVAARIYQSVRGGNFDIPASMLPPTTCRVAGVVEFNLQGGQLDNQPDNQPKPISGWVTLADGTVLNDIHHVVLATGYVTSYPFLPQLQSDTAPIDSAGDELIVTSDGVMAHNLHEDIFYIKDPTLTFVGVPYYVATFSLFDFQAQALARVFAGNARLPSEDDMRKEYQKREKEKGLSRAFHSLNGLGQEIGYVKALAEWVNKDIGDGESDCPPMLPHSQEWILEAQKARAKFEALLAKDSS